MPRGRTAGTKTGPLSDVEKRARKLVSALNVIKGTNFNMRDLIKVSESEGIDLEKVDLLRDAERLVEACQSVAKPKRAYGVGPSVTSKTVEDRAQAERILVQHAGALIDSEWDRSVETLGDSLTHLGQLLTRYCYSVSGRQEGAKEANEANRHEFLDRLANEVLTPPPASGSRKNKKVA